VLDLGGGRLGSDGILSWSMLTKPEASPKKRWRMSLSSGLGSIAISGLDRVTPRFLRKIPRPSTSSERACE